MPFKSDVGATVDPSPSFFLPPLWELDARAHGSVQLASSAYQRQAHAAASFTHASQ